MDLHPAPSAPAAAGPSPAERQAALLERLANWAMEVAEAARNQAIAAAAPPAGSEVAPAGMADLGADPAADAPPAPPRAPRLPDPTLAFDRAARAVRRTVALWQEVTREQAADDAAAVLARAEARRAAAERARERAARLTRRLAEDHYDTALPGEESDIEAAEAVDRLCAEARERLDDEDLIGDLADRPFSEVIDSLCRDIGLTPDWARLSAEPWAQAELAAGRAAPALAEAAAPMDAAPVESETAAARPARGARWRRRSRVGNGEGGPPQTRVTVRFVEPDGSYKYMNGGSPKSAEAAGPPGVRRPASNAPPPDEPPELEPAPLPPPPPADPPALSAEEIAAADYERRMRIAVYGPREGRELE